MPFHKFRSTLQALMLLLFTPAIADAHVFWIEPSDFSASPADRIELTLRVGEAFVGDSIVNIPDWYVRFSRFHDGEEKAVNGYMGDDPAGHITIDSSGSYLVLYENKPDFVELEPQKFEAYLINNGLEHVIEKRDQLGESRENAGEYYSRCAKTIVTTDNRLASGGSIKTGCTLDLLLQEHSDEARFQLLFREKPVSGVLLVGISRENPETTITARTDAEGRASFPALQPGTWLFSGVHIIREETIKSKWRSYWASLTFRIP